MTKPDPRLANVTQLARMFELSVNTVRSRLRRAGVAPVAQDGNSPQYRLSQVGPALFGGGEQ
ncbi:MAG: DUF1441 family protein, partial [Shewanella sp.]|nr:DUF1441 family protein [Shewanella sp.]